MKKVFILFILGTIATLSGIEISSATTVTLNSSYDLEDGYFNFFIPVDTYSIIKFDISLIIAGVQNVSNITSSRLGLNVSTASCEQNSFVLFRESNQTWTESTSFAQLNAFSKYNQTNQASGLWSSEGLNYANVTNIVKECYSQGESNCTIRIESSNYGGGVDSFHGTDTYLLVGQPLGGCGNATDFYSREGSSGPILEITYDAPDTCSYFGVGNWGVNCADNCTLNTAVVGDGSDISFIGNGHVIISGNITNFDNKFISGGTGHCTVTCINGGCLR